MNKLQYEYQPLSGNESIRILTLEPGIWSDPLTGNLECVSVDNPGKFEALSYAWADPGPSNSVYDIFIRNEQGYEGLLALRGGSIFAALKQLRLSDRPRRIWADQCCIDQDNLGERSQQLQFMNRIYRHATHVLVWLGLDANGEAESVFDLVQELEETLNRTPVDLSAREEDTFGLERRLRDKKALIQALTSRAWFQRGWVVQEIGTGIPAIVMWGDAEISWDVLATVCRKMENYHHLRNTLGIMTSHICFLFRRFVEPDESTHHANRFNFVYELQRARHLRFSDDRDRVFAFLGHFSARSSHPLACGPMKIEADYTKAVEETYVDVAVQILQTDPAALCIILAAVQHCSRPSVKELIRPQSPVSSAQNLPSWVPDWRWSESILLAEPICPHRAHGNSPTKFQIIKEDGSLILRAHGVEMDTVVACSRRMFSKHFYEKKSPDHKSTIIEHLWREILQKEHFNLEEKYINGQPAFFALMQTLSNGCVQATGHHCTPYHQVSDDIWLQKAAKYIVESVGSSEEISEPIRTMAASAEQESHHEQWSRWATSASEGRVFAKTATGYYVLGPGTLEAGDIVCGLFGSKILFCLRPIGSVYLLVGESYVHGLMNGEIIDMLDRGEVVEKRFDIY
ncbi:heterokaryon incompatibility protein-domain-containing protein [Xylariaceae sp. FL1019]|nr:heterokaryon incompatibility protein-domain-containing protein [Xylariaceae sp. FL1019]